jgi:tetraprenyl-beta-curcumene synthase
VTYTARIAPQVRAEIRGWRALAATIPDPAHRCGEAQSYTHAAIHGDVACLAAWARRQKYAPGYSWWEFAAGASSSVAIHALLATAAHTSISIQDVEAIDAAYFPAAGALTVLLDNLVDHDADASAATHNYLNYYTHCASAVARLAEIARLAERDVRTLRRAHLHGEMLAGVAGFYLSAADARTTHARAARTQILARLELPVAPILPVMRLRRRLSRAGGAMRRSPAPIDSLTRQRSGNGR